MDPMTLYAPPEVIEQRVQHVLQEFGEGSGHVFNLGHGILPDIDPQHVEVMVEAVHKFSRQYHR
jgi:uroporphyrinogen decarboxylase